MKGRVLVVEDDDLVSHLLGILVRHLGYTVAGVAITGEEAITLAAETEPDLVLMDIRLPGRIDGIDAATHILEHFQIPLIFITAETDTAVLERAEQVQPYGFLTKPFSERDLSAAIDVALYHRKISVRPKEREGTAQEWSPRGVALSDPEGHLLLLNPVVETLLGVQKPEVLRRDLYELAEFYDPVTQERIRRNGNPKAVRRLAFPRNGHEVYFSLQSISLVNREGVCQGILDVLQEI